MTDPGAEVGAVEAVAAEVFGGADLTVERTPDGVSTAVYRITRGDEHFYLRLAESEDDNLEVDALVHERLLDLGVRVPRIVHVAERDPRLGRSFLITADIGGRPLSECTDQAVIVAALERAGEDVARINGGEVDGFGWVVRSTPVWPPRAEKPSYADFVVDDLPDPWPGPFAHLFSPEDVDLLETLVRREQARVVVRPVLAHGDLGLDHIFVGDDGEYSGIIDFGELRGTEPEFDLAVFFNHSPREGRWTFVEALVRGYERVSPLDDGGDVVVDVRRRLRTSGCLKSVRQLGRWLQPDFPHVRDPQALAALVSRRFLAALRVEP